jgi:ribosome biogenesis protein YTM1
MSADSSSDEEDVAQVRVALKLANSVQDRSLEVPTESIAVPADIGRKGLSAVVNHLLGRSIPKEKGDDDDDDDDEVMSDDDDDGEKLPPITFEFIVKGTNNRLLRKGVEKEARQHGLSLEEAITITYFPAADVPQLSNDGETLPDWVSCLSACSDGSNKNTFVLSGCYDGSINAYKREQRDDKDGTSLLTKVNFAKAGTGPIKAITSTNHIDENKLWIASASLDHSLNIHTYEYSNKANKKGNSTSNGTLQSYGQCVQANNGDLGASASDNAFTTSLDFATKSDNSKLLASGNGNGMISIWNIDDNDDDSAEVSDKKRQKSSDSKKKKSGNREIVPIVNLANAHSQLVSGLSWGNHNKQCHQFNNSDNDSSNYGTHLISGSWDHSIKLWDVEKQNCLLTLNGARVVSCLDTSYHSEGVVATGHPDCTIRLWDLRVNTNSKQSALIVSDNTFRPSHKAWVSNVQWSQSNAYQLSSTSHDGTIKVWDIRSSVPLHTVRTFPKEEKGLSLLWLPSASASSSSSSSSSTKENNNGKGGCHSTIYAGGTDCIMKRLEV